ncbi:negative elongation factor B [Folsomia candida]|uniref:Negative elongation factor B n=1 Tax=Folsomia candida TaxID=158441 RepID=A0A226EQU8_FOLCA|nr:negative elongation factor B [Folsomia candida]OXA60005.1 Negative elongation factor B [Folsomia candida]
MSTGTGFGLEEIGIPGRDYLREALTNCSDPLKAIEEFQSENEILLPSLRPMLPLLDLHGTSRLDFHVAVMEELRDTLIKKINEIGTKWEPKEKDKKLKELLSKSFPVIKIKPLRPVVLSILKNMTTINDKYLDVILNDKDLYEQCDTEVKRQIWKDNQTLYGDQVTPLFTQYTKEKEQCLFSYENKVNLFFTHSPKIRRQGEVVKKLTHMIGNNVKLYDMVLQFLRTLFVRTKNVHYCSLRAELLMALHDAEVQEVMSVDPCHKFTWCMDACIREKNMDAKRSRELQGFLDSIKKGEDKLLGDLSVILCDPFAIHFLATTSMKVMQTIMINESYPRENHVLILLLRMLSLGLSAIDILTTQHFKEPKFDSQIVTKFLPALLSLMVDDQVRNLNAKLPPDERESAIAIIEHSGPPPDAFQAYVNDSGVAATLAMYYTLQLARQKDKVGLMRVLGCLSTSYRSHSYDDPYLHSLISLLIGIEDEFAAEDFCTVVFDEFLCPGLPQENVTKHLLRLVYNVCHKLGTTRMETVLKTLQPSSMQTESLRVAFSALEEKINAIEQATTNKPPTSPH